MIRSIALALALALSLSACAASSKGAGTGPTTSSASTGGNPAAATLATTLGIDEKYVSVALGAAQAALGGNAATATPEQKSTAAQTGVDTAAAQAAADGKPIADQQKNALLEGLKGLL